MIGPRELFFIGMVVLVLYGRSGVLKTKRARRSCHGFRRFAVLLPGRVLPGEWRRQVPPPRSRDRHRAFPERFSSAATDSTGF